MKAKFYDFTLKEYWHKVNLRAVCSRIRVIGGNIYQKLNSVNPEASTSEKNEPTYAIILTGSAMVKRIDASWSAGGNDDKRGNIKMTDKEYEKLEYLINKLSKELKCNNVGIINNYVQDGFYVSTYDSNGEMSASEISFSIKDCCKKIKEAIK